MEAIPFWRGRYSVTWRSALHVWILIKSQGCNIWGGQPWPPRFLRLRDVKLNAFTAHMLVYFQISLRCETAWSEASCGQKEEKSNSDCKVPSYSVVEVIKP